MLTTGQLEGEINFPQKAWDEQGLEKKFRWLTSHVLEERQVQELVEQIWVIEDLSDIRDVTRILA